MSGPAAELSLARRTLIAVGVAIGGSALFLSGCLLLASSLLDRAMPSKQADIALSDDAAEVAKSPTTPSEPASARSRS